MSQTIIKSPPLPWRVKFFVHAMSFGVDITRRSDGTVNRGLMRFFDLKISSSNKPINGVKTTDITIDKTRNLWFRLFSPTVHEADDATTLPVVFFFHGGGFVYMAPDSKPYDEFCRRLAGELPAVIVSVNYRLAPEHRHPCQVEDCFDVLKFIDETKLEEFPNNVDLKHCFLAGDSAGGNLAHHVALKASDNEHEFHNIKVIGMISIQPFFGGEERTESEIKLDGAPFVKMERTDWMWKSYLPEGSNRDHPAVNVFGPNADDISMVVNFPATVVVVGGFDPLQDWQKNYYEGLKKSGKEAYLIEYPNGIHTLYAYPEIPESSMFMRDVKDFVQKQKAAN